MVGAHWRYNAPEHISFFSRSTLTRMLSEACFETFRVSATPTLAAVIDSDDTGTGLYAPVRLLHKTGLLFAAAPLLRAMHGLARRLDWSDGITTYARKV